VRPRGLIKQYVGQAVYRRSSPSWDLTQRRLVLATDVSEQSIGPVFKSQALTFEDGSDRVSRNVVKIANIRHTAAEA
jgi:hypothetical protein